MKKNRLIIVLIINLLIITILQIHLIDDVTLGAAIKGKYEELLNYTYHYNEIESKENKKEETETETISENIREVESENNSVRTGKVNTGDDRKLGIVITKSTDNIYHTVLTIKSDSSIWLYYGKKLKHKKNCGKQIQLEMSDRYWKKNNRIQIKSKSKMKLPGVSEVGLEGVLYIYKNTSGLVAVNDVDIETYVCGVVASEMPESFEKEALKAQAVCARTYTYAHLDNDKYKEYNAIMDDSVSYQAYGQNTYSEKIRQAVEETKGEVLSKNNQLIQAYYFSTSCGYTTDYKIWGEDTLSYLESKYVSSEKGVADVSTGDYFNRFIKKSPNTYEKDCPFFRWNVTINSETIQNQIYAVTGKNIGDIQKVWIQKRGSGGIASSVKIVGSDDTYTIEKQYEIRRILSPLGYSLHLNNGTVRSDLGMLPSAFIAIDQISESKYKITGGGFGHGSGMSQYGANEMAKKGKKYKKILSFFYSGVNCSCIDIH